jgi:hypothetical protein
MVDFDVRNLSVSDSVDQLSVDRLETLKGASSITTPEFQDTGRKSQETCSRRLRTPLFWDQYCGQAIHRLR